MAFLVERSPTPMGNLLARQPGSLALLGAGRRAATSKNRVRLLDNFFSWFTATHKVVCPTSLEHFVGFLKARASEPANRGALRSVNRNFTFLHKVTGTEQVNRLTMQRAVSNVTAQGPEGDWLGEHESMIQLEEHLKKKEHDTHLVTKITKKIGEWSVRETAGANAVLTQGNLEEKTEGNRGLGAEENRGLFSSGSERPELDPEEFFVDILERPDKRRKTEKINCNAASNPDDFYHCGSGPRTVEELCFNPRDVRGREGHSPSTGTCLRGTTSLKAHSRRCDIGLPCTRHSGS